MLPVQAPNTAALSVIRCLFVPGLGWVNDESEHQFRLQKRKQPALGERVYVFGAYVRLSVTRQAAF